MKSVGGIFLTKQPHLVTHCPRSDPLPQLLTISLFSGENETSKEPPAASPLSAAECRACTARPLFPMCEEQREQEAHCAEVQAGRRRDG